MKLVVAVPTYWTQAGEESQGVIFDHPTPLGTPGTLTRLLDSLARLPETPFQVVIVAAPTNLSLAAAMEQQLQCLLAEVTLPYPILLVGPTRLQRLQDFCRQEGQEEFIPLLSLNSYGAVRNITLMLANLLEAELLISLDDDERITDGGFFTRILEDYERLAAKLPVFGLAGLYLNPNGTFLAAEPGEPWAEVWPKLKWLNEALATLAAAGELVPTPVALGGNMVISRKLYRRLPFDPVITRGEDIDYVINARIFGIPFYLDPGLLVLHEPPPKPHPLWLRLRQDLQRFLYTRQKLRGQQPEPGLVQVTPGDLQPYPGRFLGEDLELRAYQVHALVAAAYLDQGEVEAARQTLANLACLTALPDARQTFTAYRRLVECWQRAQEWFNQPEIRAQALAAVLGGA